MKIVLIISIIFFSPNGVELVNIPDIANMDDIRKLADDIINALSAEDSMVEIMDKIKGITERIEIVDKSLYDLLTDVEQISSDNKISRSIFDLQEYIYRVDGVYNYFLTYYNDESNVDNDTLTEFVAIVTSDEPDDIPDILNKMFRIIVPRKEDYYQGALLESIARKRQMIEPLEMCDTRMSYQNRLLQVYNLIAITEIRAFLMAAFALKLKEGDLNDEIKPIRRGLVMRLSLHLSQFSMNMLEASREIFLCDPKSLTDKNTYAELEGLFTAYVINEYESSLEYDWPCWKTCPEIDIWTYYRCYDINANGKYCAKHPCKGRVYDCGWIGGDVDICEYDAGFRKRYNYVRSYSNGLFYGKWSECGANMTYQQVNGRLSRGYRCDMCICRCEESYGSSRAIRTFSLRPQVSNIDENKVVSDVKFVEKDNMIHIQIEEAPLLPIGQVGRNQSSWVPLEDFIYLSNVTAGGWVQVKDGQYIPMTRDKDFAFIRRDQKVLNLDEISGQRKYVLTGVRLNHESETYNDDESAGNISPLQLEIHVTPFAYASGQLMPTEENPSMWLTPSTQPKIPPAYARKREKLGIGYKSYRWESPKNPPNPEPNQYIEFVQSSFTDDTGQSTLPLMDTRPTASSSPVAFDGLGLMYRGDKNFGGFVLLKAMTMDLTNYMEV